MKTLCVDLGGSRVKLALMTADSHPQPDVFEVDSRALLAQTLSLVAQHAAVDGCDNFFSAKKCADLVCQIVQCVAMLREDDEFFRGSIRRLHQLVILKN